jgi:hypothetical protein
MHGKAIVSFVLLSTLGWAAQEKPKDLIQELPADQRAIYSIFLSSYETDAKAVVNLADRTEPFRSSDMDKASCLKGFQVPEAEQQSLHRLPTEILPKRRFRLVDPEEQAGKVQKNDPDRAIQNGKHIADAVAAGFQAGMLSLSELVFSANRRYAALQYSFDCGRLCGNGETLIFEHREGKWILARSRQCSHWIS